MLFLLESIFNLSYYCENYVRVELITLILYAPLCFNEQWLILRVQSVYFSKFEVFYFFIWFSAHFILLILILYFSVLLYYLFSFGFTDGFCVILQADFEHFATLFMKFTLEFILLLSSIILCQDNTHHWVFLVPFIIKFDRHVAFFIFNLVFVYFSSTILFFILDY